MEKVLKGKQNSFSYFKMCFGSSRNGIKLKSEDNIVILEKVAW